MIMKFPRINKIITEEGGNIYKFLIEIERNIFIESTLINWNGVFITLCISSQIGCSVGCNHCATTFSKKSFIRNLTFGEIKKYTNLILGFKEKTKDLKEVKIKIIDFAAMGEPSNNWNNIRKISKYFLENYYCESIQISTIGRIAFLDFLLKKRKNYFIPSRFFISLHGYNKKLRDLVIPHSDDPSMVIARCDELKKRGINIIINYNLHANNSSRSDLDGLSDFLIDHKNCYNKVFISKLNWNKQLNIMDCCDFEEKYSYLQAKLGTFIEIHKVISFGKNKLMGCGQLRASVIK